MKKLMIILGLGCGILTAGPFQNGGFENPNSGHSFATVPTGWVKVDPSNAGLFMQLYTTFALPTLNGEGLQAYGFGGNGRTTGSLSQTFDTTINATYHVGFQYVIQQGSEFEDLKVEALDGANVLATNSIGFNNKAWLTSTLDFTATGIATTLRFSDNTGVGHPGTGGSTNWALDAVTVVQPNGPAVPEPASFSLLGLGCIAAFGWRSWKSRMRPSK